MFRWFLIFSCYNMNILLIYTSALGQLFSLDLFFKRAFGWLRIHPLFMVHIIKLPSIEGIPMYLLKIYVFLYLYSPFKILAYDRLKNYSFNIPFFILWSWKGWMYLLKYLLPIRRHFMNSFFMYIFYCSVYLFLPDL